MGKIILTESKESFFEAKYEIKSSIFSKPQKEIAIGRVAGLTPMGFDDEIGLWEEQEYRYTRSTFVILDKCTSSS